MPWLLSPAVADSRELNWDDIYNEDGSKMDPNVWAGPEQIPPQDTWPLRFRQTTKHKKVPDYCSGRYHGTLFVSRAFRDLVEAMDPVTHHYVPLQLTLHGGRESVGEFFLFKFGSFVDGIVAEKSEVGPIYDNEGRLGFYSVGSAATITWRRSAIEGRHVWADEFLKRRFFCSDAFLREVERLKMRLFYKVESFVVED